MTRIAMACLAVFGVVQCVQIFALRAMSKTYRDETKRLKRILEGHDES